MKFAKELEEELVPEWRVKYFDYRQGKKKIKAVSRALRNVNQSPRIPRIRPAFSQRAHSHIFGDITTPHAPSQHGHSALRTDAQAAQAPSSEVPYGLAERFRKNSPGGDKNARLGVAKSTSAPPIAVPERKPLRSSTEDPGSNFQNYGSLDAATPPHTTPAREMPSLELPDPAISAERERGTQRHKNHHQVARHDFSNSLQRDRRLSGRIPWPRRSASTPFTNTPSPRPLSLRRMFSNSPAVGEESIQLAAYRDLDEKQDDFFEFLDAELEKIEAFYKFKEDEATARLQVLKDQLHEMRDRRIAEMTASDYEPALKRPSEHSSESRNGLLHVTNLFKPVESILGKTAGFSQSAKAMIHSTPPHNNMTRHESERDYTRRFNQGQNVPYRTAKRKLKAALVELYRALELLKSYAIQNRTAFRKINKKFDKTLNARPAGRYMSEKVNNSYFVKSEVVEGHIVAVEDLYARYFERGNHKLAAVKLRGKLSRSVDFSQSAFRNGLFLAGGLVFGIQGLVSGAQLLNSPDMLRATRTSFLLQIYGGYFLALLLFVFFILDCRIWSAAKINYVFVFEYDTRHVLDWRQIAELPCFFFFLLGVFLWLNFRQVDDTTFTLWPAILVAITLIFMFFPAPILYHRSRQWWAYSNWRLLLAGLYPVEFRDFFLGDMYCSQTYAMGNIELFFCLYSCSWTGMDQCNSSHSRALGFLTTLPGIWRALQCLRRYYDSRNSFPHLVNCGKYAFNVLYYLTLSVYRIDKTPEQRAIFITCALINAVYCSIWDVAMDWSLGNPYARHRFLRDTLVFRRVWVYYLVMVLDPLLRQQWIFYAIFAHDLQHSALLSFIVSLAEVFRRGIWSIFRVENEHCTNVGRFRASRDVPLPYSAPPSDSGASTTSPDSQTSPETTPYGATTTSSSSTTSPHDLERQHTTATATTSHSVSSATMRQRRSRRNTSSTPLARAVHRVGTIMMAAHTQDFERKKRPGVDGANDDDHDGAGAGARGGDSTDEDEEEDEDMDEETVREGLDRVDHRRGGGGEDEEGEEDGDGDWDGKGEWVGTRKGA